MVWVGPLTLLGKPGHSPHNGLVLVLVLGQPARRLHQLLSLGFKGTQETLDALHLVNINLVWLGLHVILFFYTIELRIKIP